MFFRYSSLFLSHFLRSLFLSSPLSLSPLSAAGYNYCGSEPLYSGVSGKVMQAEIFIGVVYYQRLRWVLLYESTVLWSRTYTLGATVNDLCSSCFVLVSDATSCYWGPYHAERQARLCHIILCQIILNCVISFLVLFCTELLVNRLALYTFFTVTHNFIYHFLFIFVYPPADTW